MAFLFADSFDFYSAAADFVNAGPWSIINAPASSTTTRFSAGRSAQINFNNTYIETPTFGPSTNTLYLAFAHYALALGGAATGASNGLRVYIKSNSTTVLATIVFSTFDGSILVYRGDSASGGVLLQTWTSAFTSTTWNHWQIKLVLDSVNGAVSIRKNGDSTDTYALSGVNLSAGASASVLRLAGSSSSTGAQNCLVDDLLVFDNSGTTLNTWVGDIRAYTLFPSADTAQKDFVAAAPPASTVTTASTTATAAANQARGTRMTAAYTGQLNSCTVNLSAGITGNCRVYLYGDNGSSGPGTLLASSATVTNPTSGNVSFSFPTPSAVTKNTLYHLVFVSDAAIASIPVGAVSTGSLFAAGTVTPTSASNNPATTSTSSAGQVMTATYAFTANTSAVNENPNDGDTSIVTSSTVGALDLYDLDDLPSTPAFILAVQARAITRKSDASARSGQLAIKSGATSALGSAVLQSTSYTALMQQWSTDPNTSAAWTASAINALQAGVKVAA